MNTNNLLAQLGTVPVPAALKGFAGGSVQGGAIGVLLQLFIKLLLVGGGIYALFNLVLAGYALGLLFWLLYLDN